MRVIKNLLYAIVLVISVFSNYSYGQTQPMATVGITDGAFEGHQIVGMIIMNSTCAYGNYYHYQINARGELRLDGDLVCGNYKSGTGGEQICYLSPELVCSSRVGVNAPSDTHYKINQHGVTVNNDKVYPWVNPQQVMAILPLIKEYAEKKCDEVLFWQALDKQHNRSTSILKRIQEQEKCKVELDKLCSASNGGAVTLTTGKDITILCQ